LLCVRRHG